MFPTIVNLTGNIAIRSYGLLIAIAFIVAYNYLKKFSYLSNVPKELISSSFIQVVIISLLGARVLYVLLNIPFYIENPFDIIKIWDGGLVFYGGFFSAILYIYLKMKKSINLEFLNLLILSVFLGSSIGRIGCFFAGCCYGKLTNLPIGVTFNHPESLAPLGIKLHPTQLYESIIYFITFIIFHNLTLSKKENTFYLCLITYALIRFIIELIRGDPRITILGISITQYISIFLILISVILWKKRIASQT